MVMKRNAMCRNLRQSIRKSLGRYIAIAAIISLGAGIFVGLLMTKADMVATGQSFMDEQNMYDIRLVSNYGWAKDQVAAAAGLNGIDAIEIIIDPLIHICDRSSIFFIRFDVSNQHIVHHFFDIIRHIRDFFFDLWDSGLTFHTDR